MKKARYELLANENNSNKPNPQEPEDNSLMARIARGELELEVNPELANKETPVFWESASIHPDTLQLNICHNGQQKFEYLKDNEKYEEKLKSVKEKFPELAPGKIGKFYRYADGKTEIETTEFIDGKVLKNSESELQK